MLCGSEQTRIDTLKQVMWDVVWDSLVARGKQDLQTLATNNVHFGGIMENMGFDFSLATPDVREWEGSTSRCHGFQSKGFTI